MAELKVTFIGHASFRFESEQSVTYFDAWLDGNPTTRSTLAEVSRADLVIATHGHSDHIGDSYGLAKQTGATFVGNFELCLVAAEHGLHLGEDALHFLEMALRSEEVALRVKAQEVINSILPKKIGEK